MQSDPPDNSAANAASTADPSAAPYLARCAARVRHANIRGLRHAIREWGDPEATPVVLLHGWMDASSSWQFLVDAMPNRFRFIAFDWRGFGDSEWPQDGYWFADYHADLDAFLDAELGDSPVRLVGHSMGGNIACIYAGLRPTRIRKLVSLEGFGLPDTTPAKSPERLVQWLDGLKTVATSPARLRPYADLNAVAERLRVANTRLSAARAQFLAAEQSTQTPDGFVLKHDPRHKSAGPILYRLAEAQAAWKRVTAPVLWVQGDQSALLQRFHGSDDSDLSARAACFANIRRETLADAGHMLQHDQPEALAALLAAFLDG